MLPLKSDYKISRNLVGIVVHAGLLLFVLTPPVSAQNFLNAPKCKTAIAEAKSRIESKNVKITRLLTSHLADTYANYPENAPFNVTIGLQGAAAESVMSSPQILKAISKAIITNCEPVSLVTIDIFRTDYQRIFGFMGRNQAREMKIEEFDCVAEVASSGKLGWGYRYCL